MPKALPRYIGGKVEEGREEEEAEEEGEKKQMENELISAILAGEPMETHAAWGGVTRKAASVAPSTKTGGDPFSASGRGVGQKDWLEGAASGLKQNWAAPKRRTMSKKVM